MAILVTYVGTPEASAALRAAVSIAQAMDHSLLIVVASALENDGGIEDSEQRLWDELEGTDVAFEIRRAWDGESISEQVISLATSLSCELVVLGLVGKSEGSWSLGPQAQNILLNSPCPVLTATADKQL